MGLVLTLCKYYHWPPDFWRKMGRRYFYAIVDETHRQTQKHEQRRVGSWDGYDQDPWYRNARKESGRK